MGAARATSISGIIDATVPLFLFRGRCVLLRPPTEGGGAVRTKTPSFLALAASDGARATARLMAHAEARGCHKDAHPFFFLLRHPLSDVWWLPTNRHRLHTNRHRLPTNRHRLPTNRHRLPTNRHRLPTNRHRLPTGRHRRAYWTLRVVFFFHYGTPWPRHRKHRPVPDPVCPRVFVRGRRWSPFLYAEVLAQVPATVCSTLRPDGL